MTKDEIIILIEMLQDKIAELKKEYEHNERQIYYLTILNKKIMNKTLELDKILKEDYKILSDINAQEARIYKR